jgi:iron complex outermembrane receptor protein
MILPTSLPCVFGAVGLSRLIVAAAVFCDDVDRLHRRHAFDITTFPATNPVAVALGAPLTAEKSVNYSVGAVIRVAELDVTVGPCPIDITNRIVLSEDLTATNVRNNLMGLGFTGIGGGRFFINGIDTRTNGVDIAMTYLLELREHGSINLTLAGNFNSTDVTRVPQTAELAALNRSRVLFDRVNVLTLDEATRRTSSFPQPIGV